MRFSDLGRLEKVVPHKICDRFDIHIVKNFFDPKGSNHKGPPSWFFSTFWVKKNFFLKICQIDPFFHEEQLFPKDLGLKNFPKPLKNWFLTDHFWTKLKKTQFYGFFFDRGGLKPIFLGFSQLEIGLVRKIFRFSDHFGL